MDLSLRAACSLAAPNPVAMRGFSAARVAIGSSCSLEAARRAAVGTRTQAGERGVKPFPLPPRAVPPSEAAISSAAGHRPPASPLTSLPAYSQRTHTAPDGVDVRASDRPLLASEGDVAVMQARGSNGAATVAAGRGGEEEGAAASTTGGREETEEEEEAFIAQESLLKQLYFAGAAFLALAVARVADSLPAYMKDGRYDELITLISSLDPLLVGVFAVSTGRALLDMEERAKAGVESVGDMRKEAFEKLTEFFERANMVVFGLAMATFMRIGAEVVIGGAGLEGEKLVELFDFIEAFTEKWD